MSGEPPPLDLSTLCELGGVTPRTVRYYIQRGLLPSPGRQGPGTEYSQGHIDRLLLIRRLQSEHLPLAEIRKRLEKLTDRQVAKAVGETGGGAARKGKGRKANDALAYLEGLGVRARGARKGDARGAAAEAFPAERAQWERLTLTENLELHVRRPLSREQNKRLERLLEAARRILGGEDEVTR